MSEYSQADRQHLSSYNTGERDTRLKDTERLVHDIIGHHADFFANPQNRLNFIKEQDPDDFLRIAQYVNAKLRGEKPHQLRHSEHEKGGFLPILHTPSRKDKPVAFNSGYKAIQEYLETSSDSDEKKIEGAAMAVEALIIWVHPFNDGNGRTSRFMAKLIEDGASNTSELIEETAVKNVRSRIYSDKYATREGAIEQANNEDIMFDDGERDALREKAKKLPPDVIGIKLSIKNLLENDAVRERTLRYTKTAIKQ